MTMAFLDESVKEGHIIYKFKITRINDLNLVRRVVSNRNLALGLTLSIV
ncbi:hypothetical protein BH11PSE12_BH11PSE12_22950 [soil metagenome]